MVRSGFGADCPNHGRLLVAIILPAIRPCADHRHKRQGSPERKCFPRTPLNWQRFARLKLQQTLASGDYPLHATATRRGAGRGISKHSCLSAKSPVLSPHAATPTTPAIVLPDGCP